MDKLSKRFRSTVVWCDRVDPAQFVRYDEFNEVVRLKGTTSGTIATPPSHIHGFLLDSKVSVLDSGIVYSHARFARGRR